MLLGAPYAGQRLRKLRFLTTDNRMAGFRYQPAFGRSLALLTNGDPVDITLTQGGLIVTPTRPVVREPEKQNRKRLLGEVCYRPGRRAKRWRAQRREPDDRAPNQRRDRCLPQREAPERTSGKTIRPMIRVVIDTNIVVSAAISRHGPPAAYSI